eukprot:9904590-Ditylum_brightwellii.AAC.1
MMVELPGLFFPNRKGGKQVVITVKKSQDLHKMHLCFLHKKLHPLHGEIFVRGSFLAMVVLVYKVCIVAHKAQNLDPDGNPISSISEVRVVVSSVLVNNVNTIHPVKVVINKGWDFDTSLSYRPKSL